MRGLSAIAEHLVYLLTYGMVNKVSRISVVGNITLELFIVAECTLLYRTPRPLYTVPTGLQ